MRGSGGLWSVLAQARRANLAGAGETMPVAASPGFTRRRLLAGLAAGATVPMMPRPAKAGGGARVAIVGGGLAGLMALDTLVQAGVDAVLYEARGAVGGRIRSVTGALGEGLTTDDGGQLVNSDHEDVLALCKRFDLPLIDRQTGASRDLLIGGQTGIASALRPLAARIARDSRRADGDAAFSARIDALSAAAYLDGIGAHGSVRRWLESTIRTEYGVEPDQASALELLWNLPVVDGQDIEVLSASDERYVVAGGSQRMTDALAAIHAARIRTRAVLDRIGEAGRSVSLHFAGGTTVEADRVIIAVPAPLMRTITFDVRLPALWRTLVASMDLGRVEKLVVGCATRPWQRAIGPAGAVWAGPGFAEAWDATAGQPQVTSGAFAFLPGGAQVDGFATESMRSLADRWSAAVEPLVPGFGVARTGALRRTAWHTDPFARGAYVNYRPGQLTRFAPLFWNGAQGGRIERLSFAGEHMSAAFPGYMNGAAETGVAAARAIVADLREGHRIPAR